MKLIDKDALTEKLLERRVKNRDFGGSPYSEYGHEDDEILSFLDTLEVKETNFTDSFLEKAWDWIEDNMLSSNQQDKSRFYCEKFINYMKG